MSLAGRRVLITRAEEDQAGLRTALEDLGAQVVSLPTLVRAPTDDPAHLDDVAARLDGFDVVAVGSLAALRPLAERMTVAYRSTVGCVGRRTAEGLDADPMLASLFVGPRVVPAVFRAEALADALVAHLGDLRGRRILVPRAPEGRPTLVDRLRDAGADVEAVTTYRIQPAPAPSSAHWATAQSVDAALFLSGETLANLLRIVPEAQARAMLARVTVGVIGPVAAERARQLGIRVDVVPDTATQEALVEAMMKRLALSNPSDPWLG